METGTADTEIQDFLDGFYDLRNWQRIAWLTEYRKDIAAVEAALADGRPEDLFKLLWRSQDNGIANVAKGVLPFDQVDQMRVDLVQVIRDVQGDGSPTNFDNLLRQFAAWKAVGYIDKVPRSMIGRTFAALHPQRYHTTVNEADQNRVLKWFTEHTGFQGGHSTNWAEKAQRLTAHLDQLGWFGTDYSNRNVFPWFVADQLRSRDPKFEPSKGYKKRPASMIADLPAVQRIVILRHNEVQAQLRKDLLREFQDGKVYIEHATGTGGWADAFVVLKDGTRYLFEIKIAKTVRLVVREAMGQLLEYGYREGGLKPHKLFVVGELPLDPITRRYIERLRDQFSMDIAYRHVDMPPRRNSKAAS